MRILSQSNPLYYWAWQLSSFGSCCCCFNLWNGCKIMKLSKSFFFFFPSFLERHGHSVQDLWEHKMRCEKPERSYGLESSHHFSEGKKALKKAHWNPHWSPVTLLREIWDSGRNLLRLQKKKKIIIINQKSFREIRLLLNRRHCT